MCFDCGKSECKRGSVCTIVGELKPLNVHEMAALQKPMERSKCHECGEEALNFAWDAERKVEVCLTCKRKEVYE